MRQCLYTFVVIVCQFMLCSVWIGARYEDSESNYIWSKSGNEMTFNNWAIGNPKTNSLGNNEKCIRVSTDNGEWGDFTCDVNLPFICEKHLKWQTIAHSFLISTNYSSDLPLFFSMMLKETTLYLVKNIFKIWIYF